MLWVERGGPGDVDQLYVDATGDNANALQYRAIVNARLGRKKEALDDLALLQKGAVRGEHEALHRRGRGRRAGRRAGRGVRAGSRPP